MSSKSKPVHSHEFEAAGLARWSAKVGKDGLVSIKDEASGVETQATAWTVDEDAVRFSLPGDNGLRVIEKGKPGFDEMVKALGKAPEPEVSSATGSKPATEKAVPGRSDG